MLPDDCIMCVLSSLPAKVIVNARQVDTQWKRVIDKLSNEYWHALYDERIGWTIDVSPGFDWKCALVKAERQNTEVEALCVWSRERVRIVAPWIGNDDSYVYENALIIGSLRSGVARKLDSSSMTQGVCVDFVYDEAFELRGIRQTCLRRGMVPCHNCEIRKGCANQRYTYYLRKLNNPVVNDCLCMRVRGVVN